MGAPPPNPGRLVARVGAALVAAAIPMTLAADARADLAPPPGFVETCTLENPYSLSELEQ